MVKLLCALRKTGDQPFARFAIRAMVITFTTVFDLTEHDDKRNITKLIFSMSNNTLQFDLTARREKNLRVLKSIDENVTEILEDYSHVAVYEFDCTHRKWERLDVEGSLFITRSLSDPIYSLIVLNKKGKIGARFIFVRPCYLPLFPSQVQVTLHWTYSTC